MRISQFEYTLTDPFELLPSKEKVTSLTLHSPKMKHLLLIAPLKQILISSLPELTKENKTDMWERKEKAARLAFKEAMKPQEAEMKSSTQTLSKEDRENEEAAGILMLVQKSKEKDFYAITCEKFKELFLSEGITFINNLTPFMGKSYFDQLSFEDFESIMGKYFSFFLMSSLIQLSSRLT